MRDSADILVMMPAIGVALFNTFSLYSNLMPFDFAVLSWLYVFFIIFSGMSIISFSLYGAALVSVVAGMAGIMPYGIIVMLYIAAFGSLLIGEKGIGSTTLIMVPLVLIVIGGLAYGPYPDFVNTVAGGTPTNWNGCVTSCTISTVAFFPSGLFSPLFSGDFVGFIAGLFTSTQSAISILSLAVGTILLFLSLGLGGSLAVLGTGISFTMTDSGTRMAQSMGIVLVLYGAVNSLFGGWFNILGGGWFGLESILPVIFASIVFYGGYLQGKEIA